MVDPRAVPEVPFDRLVHAVAEGIFRLPAELSGDFGVVDGVAAVVAGAILNVGDEALGLVEFVKDEPDDLDICALVVAADVVYLAARRLDHIRYFFKLLLRKLCERH